MNLRSAIYLFRSGIVVMLLAGVCVLLTAVDKFSISFYTDLALLGFTGAVVGILQHKKSK